MPYLVHVVFFPDYGTTKYRDTVYINASTCTKQITPTNKPIIFDIRLPSGYTKDDMLCEGHEHTL